MYAAVCSSMLTYADVCCLYFLLPGLDMPNCELKKIIIVTKAIILLTTSQLNKNTQTLVKKGMSPWYSKSIEWVATLLQGVF